ERPARADAVRLGRGPRGGALPQARRPRRRARGRRRHERRVRARPRARRRLDLPQPARVEDPGRGAGPHAADRPHVRGRRRLHARRGDARGPRLQGGQRARGRHARVDGRRPSARRGHDSRLGRGRRRRAQTLPARPRGDGGVPEVGGGARSRRHEPASAPEGHAVTYLVSTDWLAARLRDPSVKALDGSWHMPQAKRDARAEFLTAHLPGAAFFDIDGVADRTTPLPHMLPTADAFAEAVGALGVGAGDRVVVYDTRGVVSAARVWWTFRAFGHDRSEEHTSELQSRSDLVCRLLLEKKKKKKDNNITSVSTVSIAT